MPRMAIARLGSLDQLRVHRAWVRLPPLFRRSHRLGSRPWLSAIRSRDRSRAPGWWRSLRHRRRTLERGGHCPAWSLAPETSPRRTRRMNGSISTRFARPPRPTSRWHSCSADQAEVVAGSPRPHRPKPTANRSAETPLPGICLASLGNPALIDGFVRKTVHVVKCPFVLMF